MVTLDDYMPQLVCGKLFDGMKYAWDVYFCRLDPDHRGECSWKEVSSDYSNDHEGLTSLR